MVHQVVVRWGGGHLEQVTCIHAGSGLFKCLLQVDGGRGMEVACPEHVYRSKVELIQLYIVRFPSAGAHTQKIQGDTDRKGVVV